jgi:uncharacterized protein (UPF0333 family)
MKQMKQTIFFATLLLLVTLSVNVAAQSRMTEQQKQESKARYEAYKTKLNLTEEQEPKVQDINANYFEALAGLKESNASRLDKFKTYRNLKSEKDKKMKQVLTKDQYKIYTEFQKEMKEEFMQNRKQ